MGRSATRSVTRGVTHTKKGISVFSAVALGLGAVVALNMAAQADYAKPGTTVATAINADAIEGNGPWPLKSWGGIEATSSTTDSAGGARVSGYAVIMDKSTNAVNNGGNTAVPAGTKIYMRWQDTDGQVSPIYYATTHNNYTSAADGAYAFSVPKWTDSAGKDHVMLPGAAKRPKIKVWFEPFNDPITGEQVVMVRDASAGPSGNPRVMGDYDKKTRVTGAGAQYVDLQYFSNVTLFGYQMPAEYMIAPPERQTVSHTTYKERGKSTDYIQGRVWLEMQGSPVGSGPAYDGNDTLAVGYKVVFSVLTPECAIKAQQSDTKAGSDNIARVKAAKDLVTANPSCIQETTTATVDNDGYYVAQFSKDTFRLKKVVVDGKTYLASDAQRNYVYGYVTDTKGSVMPAYSAFTDNAWNAPNEFAAAIPSAPPGFNLTHWYNTHFAVTPYYNVGINLDKYVANKVGETVTAFATGKSVHPGGSKVVWTDPAGKVVKTCDGVEPGSGSCAMEVPADAVDGTAYTASLYLGDTLMAMDSFEFVEPEKVAPSFTAEAPEITGVINELIEEKVVPLDNPDGFEVSCTATGLAKGLQIFYNAEKGGCVISGVPEELKDVDSTYIVSATWLDKAGKDTTVTAEGKINITKPGDDDHDGVNNHDDKCPNTPKDAVVDADGCAIAPTINDPQGKGFAVTGIKGEPITPVIIPVNNTGNLTITSCEADTYTGGDTLPTETAKTSEPASAGKEPAGSTAPSEPAESSEESSSEATQSAPEPAPAVEPVTPASGQGVGVFAEPKESTVAGLPKGLKVEWDQDQSACVISGTTDVALDTPINATVYVKYNADKRADATPGTSEEELKVDGTVFIHDRGLDDDDNDGVLNKDDACANTPTDTAVDEKGCAKAPVVTKVPLIEGTVGTEITPITVPVANDGNNTIVSCEATGLVAGLKIAWDETAKACVISGTPTEPTAGTDPVEVNVSVKYDSPDNKASEPKDSASTSGQQIVKYGDADGDGVPDNVDKCTGTPAGAKVNPDTGCTVAPEVGSFPKVVGTVGEEIVPVKVPVANPGQATDLVCHATGLAAGLKIDYVASEHSCVISGTPTAKATGKVEVTVTYNPVDDGTNDSKVTDPVKGEIAIVPPQPGDEDGDGVTDDIDKCPGTPSGTLVYPADSTDPNKQPGCEVVPDPITPAEPSTPIEPPAPKDSDNDGVNDDNDACPDTPTGTKVDAKGCAVAPTVGTVPAIEGETDQAITPVVIPVDNPNHTQFACSATGLAQGLSIAVSADGKSCEITGTPTDPISGKVTVTVTYEPVDNGSTGSDSQDGDINITKPAPSDDDGDGYSNDVDKCAGTPAGAKVDEKGCSVAPVISGVVDINGEVGKPISDVTVTVDNPGLTVLNNCKAKGLPAGLGVAWNAEHTACVISGTPTEKVDGKYTVGVVYNPVDDGKNGDLYASGAAKVIISDKDGDNDGVPNSKDKCADTPAKAKVDADGCTVKPQVDTVPNVNGEIDKPIKDVVVPISNEGQNKILECKAAGLPNGLKIALNAEGTACVISGTPTEEASNKVTVEVVYDPVDDGSDTTGTVKGEGDVSIVDSDKDKDGVDDSVDQCRNTPAGAKVDKKTGCSVAPRLGDATAITGKVGEPIAEITVSVANDGKAALGQCQATGLPKGVTIKWNDVNNKTACVISGTPTEEAGGEYAVTVTYNAVDDGTKEYKQAPAAKNTINIAKPEPKDSDGDGINDDLDKCPNTPGGTKVDQNGCSVKPSIPADLPEIKGQVNQEIDPVVITVTNDGGAEILSCKAQGLPKGLTIAYDPMKKACVISGTPTEPTEKADYTVTVTYDPQDDGKDEPATVKGKGSATIKPAPRPGGSGGSIGFIEPGDRLPDPDNPVIAGVTDTPKAGVAEPGKPPVAGVNEAPRTIAPLTVTSQPRLPQALARTGAIAIPVLLGAALVMIAGGLMFVRQGRREEKKH